MKILSLRNRLRKARKGAMDLLQLLLVIAITSVLSVGASSAGDGGRAGESEAAYAIENLKSRIETLKTNAFIGRDFGIDNASKVVISFTKDSVLSPSIKAVDDYGNSVDLDSVSLPKFAQTDICLVRNSLPGVCSNASLSSATITISLREPYGSSEIYANSATSDDSDIQYLRVAFVSGGGQIRKGFNFDRNTISLYNN